MLKYLIQKEFKQFIRNRFFPRVVVMMPVMMMCVLPWAANFDIKNINVAVVDNDHSTYSARLITKVSASHYFSFSGVASSYPMAMESIETGNADIILEIPQGFERDLVKEGKTNLMISANAVNGTKGSIGSSYLLRIINEYSDELRSDAGFVIPQGDNSIPVIEIIPQNKFNPQMDYKVFMIPAIMVMLLTMMCCFLPALNIVSEKEIGTIEQINVTPVSRLTFIFAKLIPYWIIGFVVLTLCFLIAWLMYGLVPMGSLVSIYIAALVYVLAISGFGLVISNYSETMQQAMFVMFFFVLIFILLSGLFTPIKSMPQWAQAITVINPLKYFMQIMRQIYLKGSDLVNLLPQLGALCVFVVVSNVWAMVSYKKSR